MLVSEAHSNLGRISGHCHVDGDRQLTQVWIKVLQQSRLRHLVCALPLSWQAACGDCIVTRDYMNQQPHELANHLIHVP